MKRRSIARLHVLLPIIIAISSHAQIANTLSVTDKIYGLSKFWQEVNYNFAYLDKITKPVWDSAYRAMIPQVTATTNDYEYYRLLQKFCALLKDGHTEVFMPSIEGLRIISNMYDGDHLLVLKRVDNKVIIKRIFKKDSALFPLGSEIITVNGLPTATYLRDSVEVYVSASTPYVRSQEAAMGMLAGVPGSTYAIQVKKPNGQLASYTLTHAQTKDSVFLPAVDYLDELPQKPLVFRMLNNQIAYVALNTFATDGRIDTSFEKLLPSLEKAKGIIIDLRRNGGGDDGVAFNILQHFMKDSVMIGSRSVVRLLDPFLQAVGRYVNVADTANDAQKKAAWLLYHGYPVYNEPGIYRSRIDKNIKKIPAPVVLLTGSYTESAAEDFVIAAANQPHIIRMGEATNGSSGQPYIFDLPGGGGARVCVKKDTYADGREFVGYGIQPHIKVTTTVNDYLQNRDAVLEAAIDYFKKKK